MDTQKNILQAEQGLTTGEAVEKTVSALAIAFLVTNIENEGEVLIPALGLVLTNKGVFETPITEAES